VRRRTEQELRLAHKELDAKIGGDAQTIIQAEYRANAEGISNRGWRSQRQAPG